MNAEEAVTSLAMRCNSLEDILRQQEQTISVLLGRIRDLEQFVGNEARNRDSNQNQINQLLSDRSTENLSERIGLVLQNQSERLSSLQAETQSQRASIQGLDGKVDAAFHGLENKVQSDLRNLQERVASGERATSEALQTTQASLQAQAASVQQIDAKCRDAVQGLQTMVRDAIDTSRTSVETLEARTREALRDLHSTVSNDIKAASTQLESLVHQAIRNQNEAMLTLDQRVRTEVAQLHQQEQADFHAAQQRMAAIETTGRELVQVAQTGLASEIAAVATHSQAVDARQQSAHQTLVQELAKHDQQMETIDVNWRASVMDLNGKVDTEVAGTRAQTAAGDQALQGQVGQLRDQLRAVADKLNHDLNDLAGRVQDNCVVPIERLNVTAAKQDGALGRLTAEGDKTREFLRVFSQEVDRNANQIRQLLEATLRASHSDLLERINVVAASVALRQDPEAVYAQINEALSKIWSDSSSSFATQRDVNDLQSQLASLESAIRVEIHALAEKDNDLHHRVDEVQVPLRWVIQQQQEQGQQVPSRSTPPTTAFVPASDTDRSAEVAQRELKQLTGTAEAAQNECVRIANEVRSALAEVRTARTLVETVAANQGTTPKGGEDAQPGQTDQAQQEVAARALATEKQQQATARAEALLAEVQQVQRGLAAQQEDLQSLIHHQREQQMNAGATAGVAATGKPERVSSAPSVRRVSGTQWGNMFMMRSFDGATDVGSTEAGSNAPSPTAYAGRNNEMLLPTHQFVRKKEYANFKDFTKQEIDALWVEVLNLRRSTGVSREELMVHLAQSKNTILSGVLNAMMKQENEMLAILSSLKIQVGKSLGDGTVKTDVKVFPPHNGTIDVDQLIRDIDSLSARLGEPTREFTTRQLPPSARHDPDPHQTLARVPPPPPNASFPTPSAAPNPGAPAVNWHTPLPTQTGPQSVVSSARSTEPLPVQLVPRVAPYATGSAEPKRDNTLFSYFSPKHPDGPAGSPHIYRAPLEDVDNVLRGGAAGSPPWTGNPHSQSSSPLQPLPLPRDRVASAPGSPVPPTLYASESGSPRPPRAADTEHVTAWGQDGPSPSALPYPRNLADPRRSQTGVFHLNPLQGVNTAPRPADWQVLQERPSDWQMLEQRPVQSAPARPPAKLEPLAYPPPPAEHAPMPMASPMPAKQPTVAERYPTTRPPEEGTAGDSDDATEMEEEGEEYYGGDDRPERRRRPKRSQKTKPRNSSKPRSRSGSRSGRHPSSRRRSSRSPNAPARSSRSRTPTPPQDEPIPHTTAPADVAPSAKPRPAGSANIRVYPSPEGVRVGNYGHSDHSSGGTNGHIYAPPGNGPRSSTFSSSPYDEL